MPEETVKRWIYHFTHVDNIQSIFEDRRLTCDVAARRGLLRTEVGDAEIKELRRRRSVPTGPGGYVGDYVPFYFATRSPMMYRIACEHRDAVPERYSAGDQPLVYLVTSVDTVVDAAVDWVATDGNAATATSEFTSDLLEMERTIDWPLMTAQRWNNTDEDMDRQRRRQAEFLVHRQLPVELIRWIATYNDHYAVTVRNMIAGHPLARRVLVRPGWYYGFERR